MKVCVFGAGNMGARITEVFLNAGHDVTMIDIKPEFTERGKTVITHDYEFLVSKGKMTAERKDELLASLKTSVDRKDAADADFIMEVILERMDLKKDLLEDLDKICPLTPSSLPTLPLCPSPRWLPASRTVRICSSAATSSTRLRS